jgi:multidrug efflux pump subunit AcrB
LLGGLTVSTIFTLFLVPTFFRRTWTLKRLFVARQSN